MLIMKVLLLGIGFSLICSLNGFEETSTYLQGEPVDLEALPLDKLLEMKKGLRKQDYPVRQMATATNAADGHDKAIVEDNKAVTAPNAMALLRRNDLMKSSEATAGVTAASSSMQTAFQMSLTVLSFLAFGGYVISLVTQNMRKPQRNPGMTAPKPLKTVVINQNRRPLVNRPSNLVTFGRRRKRNPTFT